ncbi:MAG: isochorismatase family protein [Planctomycetota bacterium]
MRRNGCAYECVLLDLNTQWDFLDENAPCRAANADRLIPVLRSIIAWTLRNQVPIVSAMESHRPEEVDLRGAAPYCVDGTGGQQKLDFTLLPNRAMVEGDNTLTVPLDLFQRHQQVVFRKRTTDLLANPKADRFLTQLAVREYLIFGLGLEWSVKALALGLMARNRSVTIVADACGYWSTTAAEFTLRQLAAKGAALITVEELLTRKLPRPRRYSRLLDGNGNGKGYDPGRSGIYPGYPAVTVRGGNGGPRINGRPQPPPRAPAAS